METRLSYNPQSIARVRQILELSHEGGNPQSFEISADGIRLAPRTTNMDVFDKVFNSMLPEKFRQVEVKIFYGASNLNDNYILFADENEAGQDESEIQQPKIRPQQQPQQPPQFQYQQAPPYQQPLGETNQYQQPQFEQRYQQPPKSAAQEMREQIQSALEAERLKWKNEQLENDNNKLKADIQAKQKYIDELEKTLLDSNKGAGWKDGLEGLVTNGIKIFQTLQGNQQPPQPLGNPPQPQTTQQAAYEEEEEVSEFEKRLRGIIEQVNETFNPYQAQAFIELLNEIVLHRKVITDLLGLVRARLYGKRFRRTQRREHERNAGPQKQQQNEPVQQKPFTVVQQDAPHTELMDEQEEEEDEDYDEDNSNQ